MQRLVSRIVRIWCRMYERIIELGFANIGLEAVDVLECRIGIE